eukprot:4350183-Prymnesium_polylepis.1
MFVRRTARRSPRPSSFEPHVVPVRPQGDESPIRNVLPKDVSHTHTRGAATATHVLSPLRSAPRTAVSLRARSPQHTRKRRARNGGPAVTRVAQPPLCSAKRSVLHLLARQATLLHRIGHQLVRRHRLGLGAGAASA